MLCPACQNESPDEARFCMHCGGPLADSPAPAAATSAPAPRSPGDYTPRHLARRILTMKSALEGERKQVTVLFADVKESVALSSQIDPERWHAILDRFFQILAEGVHRFDGTINQFTGDGIMALFGAPIALEDHAQRACYAALRLQRMLGDYANELRRDTGLNFSVRMGLNSGEVVVGRIGDDLRMDYTAQGETVGLAARVQQVAASDRVFLAPATVAQVRGYVALEPLGDFEMKGFVEPVELHELMGPGELQSRLEVSRARGFSRFLGREAELEVLEAALAKALDGDAQVVAFAGDAGVGKSRLAHEFLDRCRARGIRCTWTSGVSHGRNIPLVPILGLYRETLGVAEGDAPQEAREKIAGRALLLEPELSESLPLVFDFLGVPDPERPAPSLSPEARQRRLIDFDVRYSIARSQREPVVTLCEDLHWFDDASLRWLAALIERAAETRTLLVLNFRPEFLPIWDGEALGEAHRIQPFGRDDARALLDSLMGSDDTLAPVKRRIDGITLGNPFFIEEVVRSLAESGALRGEAGSYELVGRLPDLRIPPSVESLLAARIDQLPDREKGLLRTASVIGRRVPRDLLERVSGEAPEDLDAALDELCWREFLMPVSLYPDVVYEFIHPLTREVASRTQLMSRKAPTHRAVARAIEEIDAERLDERAALLAHHWEQAEEPLESAGWHHRAAVWMSDQDLSVAMRHWRAARDQLLPSEGDPRLPRELMELGVSVRLGLLQVGGRHGLAEGEATLLMAEGRELAERADDRSGLCALLVSYGNCCIFGVDFARGFTALREAEEVAETTAEPDLLLSVRVISAWSLFAKGRLRDALALNERALAALDRSPEDGAPLEPSHRGALLAMSAGLHAYLGNTREAMRMVERVREQGLDAERSEWVAVANNLESRWARERGDQEAALLLATRSVEIGDASDNTNARIHARLEVAHAQRARGEWGEALGVAQMALEELREAGILSPEVAALCCQARVHLEAGRPERALELAREALALSADRSAVDEIEARLLLARSLRGAAGEDASDEIADVLVGSRRLVDETGARYFRGDLILELAELALLRGDRESALADLGRAREAYAERGSTLHVGRVDRRLTELDPG